MSKPRLGLIVPDVGITGGVSTWARFIRDAAISSGCYELSIVSLAISARDPASISIASPSTWLRGAIAIPREWDGYPIVHVGAVMGELEFQRFRPRSVLAKVVAECDLLQVVCGTPAWATSVLGLQKPVAISCATRLALERRLRDAKPVGFAGRWKKVMTSIGEQLDERALRRATAVQVINPSMLQYARDRQRAREQDIRYAPPGIDERVFRPEPTRCASEQDPYLLTVGRFDDPRKNISLLLEAFGLMSSDLRGEVRIVLAGPANPPASFWRLADALEVRDRITYVHQPSLSELVSLYQRARAFVLTSDEEGLGIVLLEAMACAVPVVSTRSGGPDGIITDGDDGFLVPLGSPTELAARLELLCRDLDRNVEMGVRGRKTIVRRFSIDAAARNYVEAWSWMLGHAHV